MRALILAAGEGTRLRPLTLHKPKPMLPIAGRPMLEHLVVLLREHGIRELAINLHYRPESIVNHFGDGSNFGVSITYSYEPQLLGSAGAARKLSWYLTEPFIVLYGDVLTDVDLSALVEYHHDRGSAGTLVLYEVDDPTRCGIVDVDATGRIRRFVEKPRAELATSHLANAGIYVLDPTLLELIPPGRSADFGQDVFPIALERSRALYGVPISPSDYVLDIGSIERYEQAERDVRGGRLRHQRTALAAGLGIGG